MTFNRSDAPRLLMAALRTPGSLAFAAPGMGAKTFGLTPDAETNYLVRLFAARNVALTIGLLASDVEARRLWWQAGIACDALDIGAALLGFREGKEHSAARADTVATSVATLLGVAGLIVESRAGRRRR